MERDAQVAVGRQIAALIKKEVGEGFTDKYQGSTKGKVAIMVIIGSNVSFISKVKSYLWNHCHITPEKIKGHGSGLETTIKIHLSEFKTEILAYIDDEYKRVFPECKSKKIVEVKIETPVEIKAEVHRNAMSKLTKFRLGVSAFITNVFEFENKFLPEGEKIEVKKLFTFCKERDESLQVITGKDLMTALKIEYALKWLIDGENPNIIFRTNEEITVNYSELPSNLSKNHLDINFRFPPSRGAGSVEIGSRISGVKRTPSPIDIHAVNSAETFLVTYTRKSSAHKILILLEDMGWNVWITTEGDLMVCTRPCTNEEQSSVEAIVSEPVITENNVPSVEIVHKEEGTSTDHWLAAPGAITPENVGSILCTVNDRDEAFIELNKLYLNDSLFSKLSSEMQDEIKGTLKRIFQEEKTEEYAQMLLDTINKK